MKRKLIFKLITGSVITTTLFTGVSFEANAEWKIDGKGNYYFNEGNGFSYGWRKIDNTIYYFDSNGAMQKGWIKYDGSWYFLDENGALKYGWIYYNNNWYYSDNSGVMQTGIINVFGKTYYFADNGVMQTKNMIIDGQFYTIGTDGSIVGGKVPVPDKTFDAFGNCVQSNLSTSSDKNISPIESMSTQQLVDTSEIGDYAPPIRKFTVSFRDYNGEEIDKKTVQEGHSVKMIDETSREGYEFIEWNTKSDGSGRGYEEGDKVKVSSDLNLYAIYKQEEEVIPVSSISIEGDKEVEIGSKIQLIANVKPSSATNTNVKWHVVNGTGQATIDSKTGIIEGHKAGTITVYAESEDEANVKSKAYTINVVEAKHLVDEIEITGTTLINTDNGTAQLVAQIKPDNATNKNVKWIITSGSKYASINEETGVVTALSNGEVEVVAKSTDGSGKLSKPYTITITNQHPKLERINIVTTGNIYKVSKGNTIELNASLTPNTGLSSEQSAIEWSAKYISGKNKGKDVAFTNVSNTGIKITGTDEKGEIEVRAVSKKNPNIYSSKIVRVIQDASSIEIIAKDKDGKQVSEGNSTGTPLVRTAKITTSGQVLYLSAVIGPSDTETKGIEWSIINDNSSDDSVIATLSATNELHPTLTAKKDGNVTVRATAKDGTKVYGELKVNISGQPVKAKSINIDSISITRNGSSTPITVNPADDIETYTGDRIEFTAKVDAGATNKDIAWSIGAGKDFVKEISKDNTKYVLEVVKPGKFRVVASADHGMGVSTMKDIEATRTASSIVLSSTMAINDQSTPGVYMVAQSRNIDLIATVNPSDASANDITWIVENTDGDPNVRLDKLEGGDSTEVTGNVVKQLFMATDIGEVKVTAKHKTGRESYKIIKVIPITSDINITADKYSVELDKDGTTFVQMTGTPNLGAYAKYKWECQSSSKNLTATISNDGYLTIKRTGNISNSESINVTAKALDGSEVVRYKTITVTPKAPASISTQISTQNN